VEGLRRQLDAPLGDGVEARVRRGLVERGVAGDDEDGGGAGVPPGEGLDGGEGGLVLGRGAVRGHEAEGQVAGAGAAVGVGVDPIAEAIDVHRIVPRVEEGREVREGGGLVGAQDGSGVVAGEVGAEEGGDRGRAVGGGHVGGGG
jgi:hypothetical protein